MQVGHARQHRPAQALGAFGAGVGLDPRQQAVGGNLETDIAGPAAGEQGVFGEQGRHAGVLAGLFEFVYTYTDV